jgi:hypothetical protein
MDLDESILIFDTISAPRLTSNYTLPYPFAIFIFPRYTYTPFPTSTENPLLSNAFPIPLA